MLINRKSWHTHRFWAYLTLLGTLGATIWYGLASRDSTNWPGGSSLPGFTFGVLGGLICIFEVLLWPRKQLRAWPLGSAQAWLRAHIWLGVLSVPLLVFHSGLRLGGTLSSALMVLFLAVIVSGLLGLALQQWLPQRLLNDVPAETIYTEIESVMTQVAEDAEALVDATCGPAADGPGKPVPRTARRGEEILQVAVPRDPVAESHLLRDFFHQQVSAFLLVGSRSGSDLRLPSRAARMFRDLRTRVPPTTHPVVEALERCCEQRRQLEQQLRLHYVLHGWLWLHVPLSIALIMLMLVHVVFALKYW